MKKSLCDLSYHAVRYMDCELNAEKYAMIATRTTSLLSGAHNQVSVYREGQNKIKTKTKTKKQKPKQTTKL